MDETSFFLELHNKYKEIEEIVSRYEMDSKFAWILVSGIYDDQDQYFKKFKGLYNICVENNTELDQLVDFIYNTHASNNDIDRGLDDLLNGTGISLN